MICKKKNGGIKSYPAVRAEWLNPFGKLVLVCILLSEQTEILSLNTINQSDDFISAERERFDSDINILELNVE